MEEYRKKAQERYLRQKNIKIVEEEKIKKEEEERIKKLQEEKTKNQVYCQNQILIINESIDSFEADKTDDNILMIL